MCIIDRIKDQVIAKIAMQAADLYADALSNMQVGSIKSMWDKASHPSLAWDFIMVYLHYTNICN